MSSDFITVTGIRAHGHHGVFPEERERGQEFIVDVIAWLDLTPAGTSDDLQTTVNYADIAQLVHDEIVSNPVDLIETLAERISAAILAFPGVTQTQICVHKPHAPISVSFDDVSVTIVRRRDA